MECNQSAEWFKEWFNSPYYHILYTHRDVHEATQLIDHLIDYLKPEVDSRMLDLACGRGRHSVYLHSKGFDVTGVDLSSESIRYAEDFEEDGLRFFVHDMRQLLSTNAYDYVFNLFTSFGYFDRDEENVRVVRNMSDALKSGGCLVIDFLNVEKLRFSGIKKEEKEIDGITFQIEREIREERVIKTIRFTDKGKEYNFEEKVMLLGAGEFERYFQACGLEILNVFGNYQLDPFMPESSDRLIYCVRKP